MLSRCVGRTNGRRAMNGALRILCWLFVFASAGLRPLFAADAKVQYRRLDEQLQSVESDTALLFPSEAIDEYPIWSPDGRYLAANIEGQWKKLDLSALVLSAGTWRGGQSLGVVAGNRAFTSASREEISAWLKQNKLNPRKANVGGSIVELRQNELSTDLVITAPARTPVVRWSSSEENCHSLVVAPDHEHVAFICEMNGVFVLRATR